MGKYSDFSRFRNNELKKFFFDKSVQSYLKQKAKENKKGFTSVGNKVVGIGATITTPVLAKLLNLTDNIDDSFLSYVLISLKLLACAVGVVLLFLFCTLVYIVMVKLINIVRGRKLIKKPIRFSEMNPKNIEELINLFKHKVDDQICLAISIYDHVEDQVQLLGTMHKF